MELKIGDRVRLKKACVELMRTPDFFGRNFPPHALGTVEGVDDPKKFPYNIGVNIDGWGPLRCVESELEAL